MARRNMHPKMWQLEHSDNRPLRIMSANCALSRCPEPEKIEPSFIDKINAILSIEDKHRREQALEVAHAYVVECKKAGIEP